MRQNNDEASERVGATGEEEVDFRKMPREEAVAHIVRRLKVGKVRAEFILALQLGETRGDAFITRSDP